MTCSIVPSRIPFFIGSAFAFLVFLQSGPTALGKTMEDGGATTQVITQLELEAETAELAGNFQKALDLYEQLLKYQPENTLYRQKARAMRTNIQGQEQVELADKKAKSKRAKVLRAVSEKHVAEFTAGYLYDPGKHGFGNGYALELLIQPEMFLHRSIGIEAVFEQAFYSKDSSMLCFGGGLRYQYWFAFWNPYVALRALALTGSGGFGKGNNMKNSWYLDVAGEIGAKLYAHRSFFVDASMGVSRYRKGYGTVSIGTNAIYPGAVAALVGLIVLGAMSDDSKE